MPLAAAGYLGLRFSQNQETIIPYPYVISEVNQEEIQKAQSSNVIIIGDRMGVWLDKFKEDIISRASENLNGKISIYNWSRENEGLHRTLQKIKSLKKLPPLIVYHGSTQEFYEKRFRLDQLKFINRNLKMYKDDRILSAIILFPILSRFIYWPVKKVLMTQEIVQNSTKYEPKDKLKQIEKTFEYFKLEFEEMVKYIKSKNSRLVVITSPVNILAEPKETCSSATTESIESKLDDLEVKIKKGKAKTFTNEVLEVTKIAPTNARAFYMLGRAYLSLGQIPKARDALNKAALYDCQTWRGNMVFNNILIDQVDKHGQTLLDFHNELNSLIGRNILFFDEVYAQNIYYQALSNKIADLIKLFMNL